MRVPRRKISEYRAKNIINRALGLPYHGWPSLNARIPTGLSGGTFVVKVDQAIKQRFKRGLIYLDVAKSDIKQKVKTLNDKGFNSVLIEPYLIHDGQDERYISFRREREGVVFSYSRLGGIEIEANADSIQSDVFEAFDIEILARETGISTQNLKALRDIFDALHMTLLEINPYIIEDDNSIKILDTAIEVDSSAELLVDGWSGDDIRTPASTLTEEEQAIRKLDSESPASFNLEVINPDGSIFLLLSGGGASVVIADEIFTLGYGGELANYGEYSGNPNEHETERYASEVFRLISKSKATKKAVLIGGAVANFTDIQATFKGIINALRNNEVMLKKHNVRFYVRRGGPRQEQGLRLIKSELERMELIGGVYDPSVSIPQAVGNLISGVKHD